MLLPPAIHCSETGNTEMNARTDAIKESIKRYILINCALNLIRLQVCWNI